MNRNFDQIIEFHKAFKISIGLGKPTMGANVDRDVHHIYGALDVFTKHVISLNMKYFNGYHASLLRIALLLEEVSEYLKAEAIGSTTSVADALGDIGVIIDGTALTYNMDLPAIRDEIHKSNMSKLNSDGEPIKRGDGKIMKSGSWKPPQLDLIVRKGLRDYDL